MTNGELMLIPTVNEKCLKNTMEENWQLKKKNVWRGFALKIKNISLVNILKLK